MYQGQSAGEVFVGQVGIILAQLQAGQHTFIYDVLGRQRAHVEVLVFHAALYALADDVKRALELRHTVVRDARNEELLDVRLARQGGRSETVWLRGNVAQVHQRQAFALYLLNHHAQYVLLTGGVLGQKHQSRAILSLLRHWYSLKKYELVGYLQHYARAVAGLVVGTLSTAVAHVLEHLQRVVHEFVALASMDVDNHSYAARVVLVATVI